MFIDEKTWGLPFADFVIADLPIEHENSVKLRNELR